MSLQSFGFFGFLLIVAAVYLHLPQRWQSAFLLAASWVFYALAMPSMLGVTIAIAVFTYLCGRGMAARSSAPARQMGPCVTVAKKFKNSAQSMKFFSTSQSPRAASIK